MQVTLDKEVLAKRGGNVPIMQNLWWYGKCKWMQEMLNVCGSEPWKRWWCLKPCNRSSLQLRGLAAAQLRSAPSYKHILTQNTPSLNIILPLLDMHTDQRYFSNYSCPLDIRSPPSVCRDTSRHLNQEFPRTARFSSALSSSKKHSTKYIHWELYKQSKAEILKCL